MSDVFPEQEPEEVASRSPLTARGVALVGVRVAAGVVGLGVAVVTIGAASLLPLPTVSSTPPSVVVTPVPTAQQLVCPGSVLRLADDTGQGATTSSAIGEPSTRFASSSGAVDTNALDQSDASTGGTASAPTVISTPPNPADPTERILLSGAQSESVSEGDFVGLAAASCSAVSGDLWLAGGSTAVGRTTLLSLSNPTEVAATVDLELFGENGAISAPGTSGIVVPASGQRVLSLAGFAPDVVSPVVHVTSIGGQVTAELQQSTVRGLEPGGVDIVGSTSSPSLLNVIPGLHIADIENVQALFSGGPAFDDLRTTLRLFAPGTGTVATTVSVIPEDGGAGASFRIDLDAGRVVDVAVDELENGNYTIKVESDAPTIAAVRVSSAASAVAPLTPAEPAAPAVADFAWFAAAPSLLSGGELSGGELPGADPTGTVWVTIAPGPNPLLHLNNPGSVALSLTVTREGSAGTSVPLPAGASTSISVEEGQTYAITGFDSLYAAVTLAGDGLIAGYSAQPIGTGSTPVTVYP
jgi:hypothetical protein